MAINKYSTPIQNTLEQYVPLPFQEMLQAGQAIQARGDAADAANATVQTGLSSMEALAPGYSQFRDKFATDYRSKASELLDKYGGNTSNPEFIRDSKRLNLQYANDPRLQTIKQGNELYRQNQQIAAKMKAEGKLFLQPNFTGLDERGNITANVPGVEAVNTLEDWTNRFKVAHESLEDIGTKTTNTRNLDRTRKLIMDDINSGGPESSKLVQAYIQQGLSPERAKQAVMSNLSGLTNQYGKVTKTNTALLNYGLSERQFAASERDRSARLDIDRYKAETARQKVANAGKDDTTIAPSFNEFKDRIGTIAETATTNSKDPKRFIFGSGNSQYGTTDKPVKNQKISGQIYDITDGNLAPKSKTVDIREGTLKGYVNAWVDKKTGRLLASNSSTAKPRIETINGKTYAYKDGKPYEVEQRTMAEYNYLAKDDYADKTDAGTVKSFYKAAAPKDAMREMGYSNAFYEGMGRTSHGSFKDSRGKARLDYNFIKSNIANSPQDIQAIQNAERAFNNNTATEEQKQLLNIIESYDSRRSIYDNEILPYFKNQGKTKSIVEEED